MNASTSLTATIPSAADELWYTWCNVQPSGFGTALDRGDFEREFASDGITWRRLQESTDPATLAAHYTHTKQSLFRHGGNIPPIWARANGADTRLIGVSWSRTNYYVMAMPDSGIEGPADLRGRRLHIPLNHGAGVDIWRPAALRVYEAALASAGLTLADVELVEVDPGRMMFESDADDVLPFGLRGRYRFQRDFLVPLVRGEVDAVMSHSYVAIELAEQTGARPVFDARESTDPLARVNNDAPNVLTVSGRLLDERPDLVTRVVHRVLRAEQWAVAHRAELIGSIARQLEIPAGLVEPTFGADLTSHLRLSLDAADLDAIRAQLELLVRHGVVPAPFDVDAWATDAPLIAARRLLAEHPAASA